jgi:dTDP-6-deoxy-L-talose 4-dehydrogenase (NAD+)
MPFRLKWLRLFYTYGEGQSENSLLRQLQRALDRGDAEFNMSPGDQLRDYLPVGQMADRIVRAGLDLNRSGIFNCCSGQPVSVSTLVEDYIARHGGKIRLNKGYYPYPDYEPHSFWGHPDLTS